MTDPRKISIHDFTYSLPEERIAKYPLEERDASRLLIYKDGKITEDIYKNIAGHIPPGSLVVFNDTKVVEARLLFQKPSGGIIEIFCLEPHEQYKDITTAMMQQGNVLWQCLIGGASKWKQGQLLEKKIHLSPGELIITAKYVAKRSDSFIIELSWQPAVFSFAEVLHYAGAIPLPPYIKRNAEPTDTERYQTVYAQYNGSVAAPTAGLHFTKEVFEKLNAKNIDTAFVTLHVGAGTFKPVKAEIMKDHEMHAEFIDVSKDTIETISGNTTGAIIAAGTTSLRTIESLYWLGVKIIVSSQQSIVGSQNPIAIGSGADSYRDGSSGTLLELGQWEVYDIPRQNIPVKKALEALSAWMEKNKTQRLIAKTKIIIAPGYKPKIVKALITNFHQPQSTLLLLVAALIGNSPAPNSWKTVYQYAMENEFRFLSYGDGSLLWVDEIP